MKIVNLTPHTVVVAADFNSSRVEFPSEGVARVSSTATKVDTGFGLGEVAEHKSLIEKQMLKIMDKVELKDETAILPNPCYVQCGDNLQLLKSQPNESVNMIYCDILYGTGRNFGDYQDLKPIRSEIESHYLPRLIEMKRVLKQNGSIYLQMDTRINHWMRILMDEVFGYENFRNEICWKYDKWSNVSNCFQRNHDVILFYSFKGAVFNELREPIEAPRKRNLVEMVDGKKVSKRIDGDVVYREQFDRPFSDVFTDIPRIPNTGAKVIGYATQKPTELISRFVLASTNEGDVVADYYLGSGTTAKVCQELNRNFIGCDLNPKAIEITKSRLNGGQ